MLHPLKHLSYPAIALWVVFLLSSTLTAAHAYLESSVPSGLSVVTDPPADIVLVMSEPIEMRFSRFEVYALSTTPDMSKKELVKAAQAMVDSKAEEQKGGDEARANTTLLTQDRQSDTITLALDDELQPGTYVVIWRILSVDTHTLEDFTLFTYAPEPAESGAATAPNTKDQDAEETVASNSSAEDHGKTLHDQSHDPNHDHND